MRKLFAISANCEWEMRLTNGDSDWFLHGYQSELRMKDISDFAIVYCRHATEQAAALERTLRKQALRKERASTREPEITFRPGSTLSNISKKHRKRKETAALLETAIDLEPVLVEAVNASAPTVSTQILPISSRRVSKTPRTKSKPKKRGNLRTTLVRDLKKEQRELKKRLKEVARDLKSLHAR